jgi:hypothetical protein
MNHHNHDICTPVVSVKLTKHYIEFTGWIEDIPIVWLIPLRPNIVKSLILQAKALEYQDVPPGEYGKDFDVML